MRAPPRERTRWKFNLRQYSQAELLRAFEPRLVFALEICVARHVDHHYGAGRRIAKVCFERLRIGSRSARVFLRFRGSGPFLGRAASARPAARSRAASRKARAEARPSRAAGERKLVQISGGRNPLSRSSAGRAFPRSAHARSSVRDCKPSGPEEQVDAFRSFLAQRGDLGKLLRCHQLRSFPRIAVSPVAVAPRPCWRGRARYQLSSKYWPGSSLIWYCSCTWKAGRVNRTLPVARSTRLTWSVTFTWTAAARPVI